MTTSTASNQLLLCRPYLRTIKDPDLQKASLEVNRRPVYNSGAHRNRSSIVTDSTSSFQGPYQRCILLVHNPIMMTKLCLAMALINQATENGSNVMQETSLRWLDIIEKLAADPAQVDHTEVYHSLSHQTDELIHQRPDRRLLMEIQAEIRAMDQAL